MSGRMYSMSSLGNSIIKANTVEDGERVVRVGEIINIWKHTYYSLELESTVRIFALVCWYKRSSIFAPRSVGL